MMNVKDKIQKTLELGKMSRERLADALDITVTEARSLVYLRNHLDDVASSLNMNSSEYVQKIKRQQQRAQDTSRIERKTWRKHTRLYNELETKNDVIIELLQKHSIDIKTNTYTNITGKPVGIIHLSDLHANEVVEGIHGNAYDMNILSQRIEKHIKKCTTYFNAMGVTSVVLVMTGDNENSNRRNDEVTAQVTSRTVAQFLVSEILINAIIDLNKTFNVSVSYVDGNESRVDKDLGWNETIVSDTFDTSIYCIVRRVLQDKAGITFDSRLGGKKLIKVNGQYILLIHGHQSGFSQNPQNAITKLRAQYASKGINIRMVLFGHIHTAYLSEIFARGGSTVGANAYSENALTCDSRASQNCYLVYEDGSIDATMIDLQEYTDYKGYPLQEELANIKARNVITDKEEIFEV